MNRQQWKDVLEAIGFLAIIGSLYFVGIETRHTARQTALNTQAVEISAYQELISNISNSNALSIGDPDAAEIMLKMRDGDPDSLENWQVASALYLQFRHGDIAYFMYERGAIDEDRLRSTLRPLPLRRETGIRFWRENKYAFVKSYQRYVDGLLEEGFYVSDELPDVR